MEITTNSNPNLTQNQQPTHWQQARRIGLNAVKYAVLVGSCSPFSTPLPTIGIVSLALAVFNEIAPYSTSRAVITTIAQIALSIPFARLFERIEVCPPLCLPSSLLKCGELLCDLGSGRGIRGISMIALGLTPSSTFERMTFIETGIVGPVTEEILFRGVIQELLLRRIPEMILRKIAPQQAWIVNSTPCKALRLFTSAMLFALSHPYHIKHLTGGAIPEFFHGLFYGYITEVNGNIAATTQLHMTHNSIFRILK